MKNFLVIYYSTPESIAQMKKASPEEIQAGMEPWMTWKAANEANVVNFGAPLATGLSHQAKEEWQASDKNISGFSQLQAESLEQAQEILKDHPHSPLSVHEFMSM